MNRVTNREPWLASILSMILIGLGQYYAGKKLRGAIFFILSLILSYLLLNRFLSSDTILLLVVLALLLILYVFNIIDAHYSVRNRNEKDFEKLRKEKKDPWLAVFLSSLIPGLGHIYIKKIFHGIIIIVTLFILLPFAFELLIKTDKHTELFIKTIIAGIFTAVVIFHVYIKTPVKRETTKRIISLIAAVHMLFVFLGYGLKLLIVKNVVQAYYIPAGSMKETLQFGDHIFIEKVSYNKNLSNFFMVDYRKIDKGDIIVFRPPHEKSKDYVKRCVAIEGDEFTIKNSSVIVNNKKVNEPYAKGNTDYFNSGTTKNNIIGLVPENKLVVLGDNRENSLDSRYFGYINSDVIKGRVFLLYWNTKYIEKLNFSRFGFIR